MSIGDYILHVNISQAGKQPYLLQTIQFFLPAFKIKLDNRMEIRNELSRLMEAKNILPVPEKTPFFLGGVILSTQGHQQDLDHLVGIITSAMQGVVFKDLRWCDGISVIRDKDGDTNDCRIHLAWKVDPPKQVKAHPLFGDN